MYACEYLVELLSSLLLEAANVGHCEAVPLVRPAEQLPVEVGEQTSLLLHRQTHRHMHILYRQRNPTPTIPMADMEIGQGIYKFEITPDYAYRKAKHKGI